MEGRGPRITLIVIVILVIGGITAGAELLLQNVELRSGLLPVLGLLATVIMVAFSGVCLGFLRDVIVGIWELPTHKPQPLGELLKRLGRVLKHPARVVLTLLTTGAVAAVGLTSRDDGIESGPLKIMTAFPADAGGCAVDAS